MATANTFSRLRVKDYSAFRKVYDEFRPTATAAGSLRDKVLRAIDDPTTVMVHREFASLKQAQDYYANPELKAAMERAGVLDKRIELFEEIQGT